MKKRLISGFAAVSCIITLSAVVWAINPSEKQQLDNFKVSTLKGLPGVAVSVKITRDSNNTLPLLKESDLQREVEIALQKADVEVLRPTPEVGLYVVVVKAASAGKDGIECAVHIQSSLLQIVHLARDTTIKTEAQTWPLGSRARFGVVSLAIAQGMILQSVKEQAKEFIDDYKTANPKP